MFFKMTKAVAVMNLLLIFFARSVFASAPLASDIPPSKVVLIALILGLTAAIVIFMLYREKVRSDKIESFARSVGLTYRRKGTKADLALVVGCHLANRGYNNRVSNILEVAQTPELTFTLFDYQYAVNEGGRAPSVYQQTISRMQSSLLHLPAFMLGPETVFDRIGYKITGRTDVNFDDSPAFSRSFRLRVDDEPAARAIFNLELRKALEQFPDLSVEGYEDHLFLFREGSRTEPEEFSAAIESDKRILSLFFEAQQAKQSQPG